MLLRHCLLALISAHHKSRIFQVIVVDNGSTDSTEDVVKGAAKNLAISYIVEENVGLSYARNAGAKAANTKWLLYIDDDAKVCQDIIAQAKDCIKEYNFKIVSGIYVPWYLQTKPSWIPESFGEYQVQSPAEVRPIGANHLSGGIMLISKAVLCDLGYFPTDLGMIADKIAYGEDTYIQYLAEQRGIPVGINPFMKMEHLVADYKLSLRWMLKAEYARGRDLFFKYRFGKTTLLRKILSLLVRTPQYLVLMLVDLIASGKPMKRVVLDHMAPIFRQAGKVVGFFKYKDLHRA